MKRGVGHSFAKSSEGGERHIGVSSTVGAAYEVVVDGNLAGVSRYRNRETADRFNVAEDEFGDGAASA